MPDHDPENPFEGEENEESAPEATDGLGTEPGPMGALLDNVMRSLTAISLMTLSATMLMGIVGGTVMYIGARQILATPPTLTLGGWFAFVGYLAFLVAPMLQMVAIGTQLTEALAGLDRTQEVLAERPEDEDTRRVRKIDTIQGYVS